MVDDRTESKYVFARNAFTAVILGALDIQQLGADVTLHIMRIRRFCRLELLFAAGKDAFPLRVRMKGGGVMRELCIGRERFRT